VPEYRIVIAASAAREFDGLPDYIQLRVRNAIDLLATDPRPRGTVKLRGSTGLFRIRVGDYRVIFRVSDRERLIDINHIRHRREAYE
jgi:mRNA interferase RelE/StbE